ncbi:hypothetical protein IWZ00DRAFT_381275 [Phyllosticta capitalensis]
MNGCVGRTIGTTGMDTRYEERVCGNLEQQLGNGRLSSSPSVLTGGRLPTSQTKLVFSFLSLFRHRPFVPSELYLFALFRTYLLLSIEEFVHCRSSQLFASISPPTLQYSLQSAVATALPKKKHLHQLTYSCLASQHCQLTTTSSARHSATTRTNNTSPSPARHTPPRHALPHTHPVQLTNPSSPFQIRHDACFGSPGSWAAAETWWVGSSPKQR